MRIVLFIDSLTSGGAQRQLTWLARLLKDVGHDVSLLIYYDKPFFNWVLEEAPVIPVYQIKWKGQLTRLYKVWKFLRQANPDLVISFLHVPNFLASIVRLVGGRFRLIVSERNNDLASPSLRVGLRLRMHSVADVVVPNSFAQSNYLAKHAPYLKSKMRVISNCVDLDLLARRGSVRVVERSPSQLRLVVLARIDEQKNGLRLAKALGEYNRTRGDLPIVRIDWYGRESHMLKGIRAEIDTLLEEVGIEDLFFFHEPVENIVSVYHAADALCLPSLHEGCANVICEGMAAGLPILASSAGDNPYLVEHEKNGLIFDGFEVGTIVKALIRFAEMSHEERSDFGRASRVRAEQMLSKERFLKEWTGLIESV